MAKMYGKGKTAIESEDQQKLRWQVELEFVQCLANPNYLNCKLRVLRFRQLNPYKCLLDPNPEVKLLQKLYIFGQSTYMGFTVYIVLAQRGYFKDQSFINYLKYLQYWKEPEYAKYLMYPLCLYFLDLLQYEHFRREIVNSQCCKFIDDQAILQWQHYTRKRIKMLDAVNGASGQMHAGEQADTQQQPQQGSNAGQVGGMLNGIGNNVQMPQQHQQQAGQQQDIIYN